MTLMRSHGGSACSKPACACRMRVSTSGKSVMEKAVWPVVPVEVRLANLDSPVPSLFVGPVDAFEVDGMTADMISLAS